MAVGACAIRIAEKERNTSRRASLIFPGTCSKARRLVALDPEQSAGAFGCSALVRMGRASKEMYI